MWCQTRRATPRTPPSRCCSKQPLRLAKPLQSENYLFFADQNLYIAKMCKSYLDQWKAAEPGPIKDQLEQKFRRHASKFEKGLQEVDVAKEFDILQIKFKIIVRIPSSTNPRSRNAKRRRVSNTPSMSGTVSPSSPRVSIKNCLILLRRTRLLSATSS